MFTYLKYFYVISFVLIVIGSVVIGFLLRSMMVDGLELAIKRDNLSLAQGFINTVWRAPAAAYTAPPPTGGAAPASQFGQLASNFTRQLTTMRFAVYSYQTKLLFTSSNQSLQNSDGTLIVASANNPAYNGQIASRIMEHVKISGSQQPPITALQTFFPIPNPSYNKASPMCAELVPGAIITNPACQPAQGVIEIITDVSEQWRRLDMIQLASTGSIIGIFIILISILMFTTRRAEAIIAKQHELNLELTAAAASAQAQNHDKSQFLANISHELRTPLNAIIGFSEIIKKEALENLSSQHQEYIADIHNSGKHLLSLINDILDFSKAEAGKLEMEHVETDISKLILNSMRLVIPRAEEAQVTLLEDLPQDHIVCRTDGKKLKQVLLNLLSNAVKFTPAGGEVKVSAWEQLLDHKVCIQVKDTGIGIAPKDIAKVMTPFGQVDSKLSRRYEGTGLGLPLSKKFVEIMGGEFIIESEVDKGTTITLKFPGIEKDTGIRLKSQS